MTFNIEPYYRLARLDKPTGIYLLLLPCWFGLALSHTTEYWLYALFAVGAVVMRSSGCIINDIFDRKLDASVERTKTRPLASGELKIWQALIFLIALLIIGLGVLLCLNWLAIYIALAIAPLIVLYPLMKRITYWPQITLGVVFNSGVLIAYASAADYISFSALILYLGCIGWTLGYDTIYAIQDIKDDKAAGIKSTALKFAPDIQKFVGVSYFAFAAAVFVVTGWGLYSNILWALAALHLAWQVYKTNIEKPEICGKLFKANVYTGLLVLISLFLEN